MSTFPSELIELAREDYQIMLLKHQVSTRNRLKVTWKYAIEAWHAFMRNPTHQTYREYIVAEAAANHEYMLDLFDLEQRRGLTAKYESWMADKERVFWDAIAEARAKRQAAQAADDIPDF